MDTKTVLTKAKALIATMDTWCQGTLARRVDPSGAFYDTEPDDLRACQWCLDGAVYAAIGAYELDEDQRLLHREAANRLSACAEKHFGTTDFVCVNDGDYGLPEDVPTMEGKQVAFENTHKVLDCAIASA